MSSSCHKTWKDNFPGRRNNHNKIPLLSHTPLPHHRNVARLECMEHWVSTVKACWPTLGFGQGISWCQPCQALATSRSSRQCPEQAGALGTRCGVQPPALAHGECQVPCLVPKQYSLHLWACSRLTKYTTSWHFLAILSSRMLLHL